MNPTPHTPSATAPNAPRTSAGGAPAAAASPVVRDERRAWRIVIVFAALAVLAVLAFNLLAPRDRLRAPDAGAPAAGSTTTEQRQQPATTAPGDGTVTRTVPQQADSPTPAGRESVGAPQGATPTTQPPAQDAR